MAKNGLAALLVAVVAAIAAYVIYYRSATTPVGTMLAKPAGEMEWLKSEFHLNEKQFAKVQELHREYAPKCDRMCEKIAEAQAHLDNAIKANRSFTPDVDAALTECVAVQADCRRALLKHVYAVSAEMSPDDG